MVAAFVCYGGAQHATRTASQRAMAVMRHNESAMVNELARYRVCVTDSDERYRDLLRHTLWHDQFMRGAAIENKAIEAR